MSNHNPVGVTGGREAGKWNLGERDGKSKGGGKMGKEKRISKMAELVQKNWNIAALCIDCRHRTQRTRQELQSEGNLRPLSSHNPETKNNTFNNMRPVK